MPIDSNIFFQGAALNQQNAARTQDTLRSFFDTLAADKLNKQKMALMERELAMKEKAASAPDLDAMAQSGLYKFASGVEPTPQEMAAIKAADYKRQTALTIDPSTGRPIPAARSIFDVIGAVPQRQAASPVEMAPAANVPYMQQPSARDVSPQGVSPVSMEELQAPSAGIRVDGPAPQLFDTMTRNPEAYSPPSPVNPMQEKEAYGSKLKIAEEQAKAGIDIEKKGIEEETIRKTKEKGIADLISNIDLLIKDAEGTPSGMIEGAAATVSEAFGTPNKQAIKRAAFSSGKAIAGLQSRIAFLKGQGVISDSEAAQAMAYLPDLDAPLEIKKAKLESAKVYMNGLIGKQEAAPTDGNIDPIDAELNRRGITR